MEPKGGDKPSNRKSSRGVSSCRKQSSRQYERALPLAIPEIRPWGGVSKYKESAYGDVSCIPIAALFEQLLSSMACKGLHQPCALQCCKEPS